jgi:hypothetical protein
MRSAVRLHRIAEQCLGRLGPGKATRLVLSLFFKAVLGIARVFHFETLDDHGFAILTGGTTVLGRNLLGGLIRAAPVRAVLSFVRRTEPKLQRSAAIHVSVDEHAIARFTRKFQIKKGFHTIRNKHMKIEKIFCSFDVKSRKLLSVIVTRGNATLGAISQNLIQRIRPRARGATVRTILDAGAAVDHTQLLALADKPNQVTIVRVPRRPAYRKRWAAIPPDQWARYQEDGPYKGAPPKIVHIAEIRMRVAANRTSRQRRVENVRTIVVREQRRRGKDRWHALWVFDDDTSAVHDIVHEFRARQHHEQRYRVMLHDAFVDTAPSGYSKNSPNPRRPGFQQNALTLYAWVAALATNALDELTGCLPKRFLHAHPRTLRRWLFNVKADIFLGNGTLLVMLKPKRLRSLWLFLIRRANSHPVRIPWMDNRRLILSIDRPEPILPQRASSLRGGGRI